MPKTRWQPWEIQKLSDCIAHGGTPEHITIDARSLNAIRGKATRLGLIGDGVPRRRWPASRRRTLRSLVARGLGPRRIARAGDALLGYSRDAIAQQIRRLGLADPGRSRRARAAAARRFTEDARSRFRGFLRAHAASCTPEQLALRWNTFHQPKVRRGRVIYHLVKLGLKRPWREVMRMPFSRLKRQRRSPLAIASQERRWRRYRAALEKRLRTAARTMRQAAIGEKEALEERPCVDCPRTWPAAAPFFKVTRKETRQGPRAYVGHICALCRNERRRRSRRAARSA